MIRKGDGRGFWIVIEGVGGWGEWYGEEFRKDD
jgi:hypothetical protein